MKGKKTYIFVALGILSAIAYSQGWLNEKAFDVVISILGFGSIAALRNGVAEKGQR
ncbi:MAG: hypothetical protein BWY41_00052 [Candidatus Atribacteria bacterium ADurb.Bin276]|uniref:Uncharacterized protein n=1 Tax=Candidatus Atribacter allofermentans TaxID=1852833 RepID=A0A1V5T4D3_9BACT|nr:MAG: hypothetical protein BWY41_00052 [Candidatus Atribacteria bacterium ADurb.Bin276]